MDKYITILAKLARIKTIIVVYLFFIIGYLVSGAKYSFNANWILGFVAILSWYINATSINDLADEEIDKINLKGDRERPLLDDSKNRRTVWTIYYISAILAILVSATLGVWATLLGVMMLLLNYIYSMPPIRVSYRGLWAPLALPLGYVLFPFMLGFFSSKAVWTNQYLILLVGVYCAFTGRLLLKDYRDVKGDKKFGKLTYLVRHGNKATASTAAVFWVIGASLIGFYFRDYWSMLALTAAFLIAIIYFLYKLSQSEKFSQQKWWLTAVGRAGNIVALAIILLLDTKIRKASSLRTDLWVGVLFAFGIYYLYPIYIELKNSQAI